MPSQRQSRPGKQTVTYFGDQPAVRRIREIGMRAWQEWQPYPMDYPWAVKYEIKCNECGYVRTTPWPVKYSVHSRHVYRAKQDQLRFKHGTN